MLKVVLALLLGKLMVGLNLDQLDLVLDLEGGVLLSPRPMSLSFPQVILIVNKLAWIICLCLSFTLLYKDICYSIGRPGYH